MWEVIGYEVSSNEQGEVTGYTLYLIKPFKGSEGFGTKASREWYRPNIGYKPAIGDKIVLDKEQRGKYMVITDIIVM